MASPSEAAIILPLASPAPTVLDSDDDATDVEILGVWESSASGGVVGGGYGARGDFVGGVGVPGSTGVSGSRGLDDSFPDNLMNGSASYILDESQEEAMLRSHAPRRVVWAVKDVLPAAQTIRSPAVLPPGDGPAVAGMMRAAIAPPGVRSLGRVEYRCPGVDGDTYEHSCQIYRHDLLGALLYRHH